MMSNPMMSKVLLVDDDPLVCRGLELILSSADDVHVVGQVHDGDQVIEAIHRHDPDVVLMDVRMARLDGITATARVRALPNPPRVIVLTTFEHDDVVLRAVHAGAAGFLLKTASPGEIVAAIRDVAAGEAALSARSARALLEHLQVDPVLERRRVAADLVRRLTPREIDVVRCVGRGLSNAQVAKELFLGEATVKSHLSGAQVKMGVSSRPEVAVLADRAGLL